MILADPPFQPSRPSASGSVPDASEYDTFAAGFRAVRAIVAELNNRGLGQNRCQTTRKLRAPAPQEGTEPSGDITASHLCQTLRRNNLGGGRNSSAAEDALAPIFIH